MLRRRFGGEEARTVKREWDLGEYREGKKGSLEGEKKRKRRVDRCGNGIV